MKCDNCDIPAKWIVYAAYDVESIDKVRPIEVHPLVARYPMPMIRACDEHLTELITKDNVAPFSTDQYILKFAK